jgi:hypothetical protein
MVNYLISRILILFILGACASRMKDQIKDYKEKYTQGNFELAQKILEESELKEDKKSILLWHLERGTLSFDSKEFDKSIEHFQEAIDLIDRLFTKKLSSKAAAILINDASDDFYGSSFERSYAYYYLSKSYYARFLKSNQSQDLQGARAAILAWDSYFGELERSGDKSLYFTDLMLKIFGAQIHEVSEIKNDKQISLQLYKDALRLLDSLGGMYAIFNKSHLEYIKFFKSEGIKPSEELYVKTENYEDLKNYLHIRILTLTKDVRAYEIDEVAKSLKVSSDILGKIKSNITNVSLVLEEGFIPPKVGKVFNIGLKGAMSSISDSSAKKFIATVGVEAITLFAMNTLGMSPTSSSDVGGFIFAHNVTKVAVAEAGIEFELPSIENYPDPHKTELFILNTEGKTILQQPFVAINDNGDLAKVVLEEEMVSHYFKTGTRVASKHIVAIIAAMGVYQKLKGISQGGDLIAKTAALGTYVGASKGLSLLEKADTRQWSTLPRLIKISDLSLPNGSYQLGIARYDNGVLPKKPTRIVGQFTVGSQKKTIHHFRMF